MKNTNEDLKKGCAGCFAIILLLALVLFVTPLFLMWGWNLGVIALFPSFPAIGYWTAFWVDCFIGVIGGKFKHIDWSSTFDKLWK